MFTMHACDGACELRGIERLGDVRLITRLQCGGAILAHNTSLDDLKSRTNDDPFVAQGVVSAEILEIAPSTADERVR